MQNNSLDFKKDRIFVVYGEEDLLRFEYLEMLKKQAQKEQFLNKTLFVIENINFKWDEIEFALKEQGLFCEKKVIEIQIPKGNPGAKGMLFLSALSSEKLQDTLIFILLPKLEKKQLQSSWFQTLKKNAKLLEAKKVTTIEFPQFLKERIRKFKLDINKEAVDYFIDKTEGNMFAAQQEIEKLSYLFEEGHFLTVDDIDKNVANVARHDIYELSPAWMSGNLKKTTILFESLKDSVIEPTLILWIIAEDIRTLIHLKMELKAGKTINDLKYRLRLFKGKDHAAIVANKRVTMKKLLLGLQKCSQIDMAIKGVDEAENLWIQLKALLIELSI